MKENFDEYSALTENVLHLQAADSPNSKWMGGRQ
jgi:hypothetical protein